VFVENEFYRIRISEDKTFTLDSVDNKPYDCIINPSGMRREDHVKALSITIDSRDKQKRIALLGSLFGTDEDVALLESNELIVLMNTKITVISCQSLSVSLSKSIAEYGAYFSIHRFDNGFVINGELEVLKLSSEFNRQWSFTGSDIFVTRDGSSPFRIANNLIHLSDWSGRHYVIDRHGRELTDDS